MLISLNFEKKLLIGINFLAPNRFLNVLPEGLFYNLNAYFPKNRKKPKNRMFLPQFLQKNPEHWPSKT